MELPQDFVYNDYTFSYDINKLQHTVVYNYLHKDSYWAQGISMSIFERSIQNSICISVLDKQEIQVGFGRMITDYATFAYLADIFILPDHRGQGLSKIMIGSFCTLAKRLELRRMMLATKDAHTLYTQYGFELSEPGLIMIKKGD